MKTKKIAAIFIIMVLCAVPAAFSKVKQPPLSGTRQASCVIRITSDYRVGQMREHTLDILRSSGVGASGAKDILGYDPQAITGDLLKKIISTDNFNEFTTRRTPGDQAYDNIDTFSLKVAADDAPVPAAEEFMREITLRLKVNLTRIFEDYKERLDKQIKIVQDDADKAEKDCYSLQEQLRKITGSRDFFRKAVLADINNLQVKIDDLTIDIAEYEGLLEDIPKQIENIRKSVEQKLKTDPVLFELNNMVNTQQQQIDAFKKGGAPISNLSEAEEKLAMAKMQLARRKEEIQRSAGGDRIDSLNQGIADASNRMNLDKKRWESLLQRLDEAKKLLACAGEYEVLSIKADIAKSSLRKALERLDSIKQSVDLVPPTITIMGAD